MTGASAFSSQRIFQEGESMNRFSGMGMAVLAVLGLVAAVSAAGDKPKKEPRDKDQPIKATLVAKKAKYPLDLGGKTSEEFQKELKDAAKTGRGFPAAPAVDLALELKNTTDKDITVWIGGTPTTLNLKLEGKGAESVVATRIFPRIYMLPKSVTLAAGKTHTIPIKNLQYGIRGMQYRAYWTRPGEYKLTASYRTAINPAPKDAQDAGKGFGIVTLTSKPVKIKVEAK
jgi:hypothetical protein